MNRKIVFLGGIHGTGKGFVSEKLCELLYLRYLSASELIKWRDINTDAQNKTVDNISDTQDRLLRALAAICVEGQSYILDGHYCLLNGEGKPTKVPFGIFEQINPIALLLTIAEPEIIVERLWQRDMKKYDVNLIYEMQQLEKEYATEISAKLHIPMFIVDPSDTETLGHKIKNMI